MSVASDVLGQVRDALLVAGGRVRPGRRRPRATRAARSRPACRPFVASARLGYTSKWMCGHRPAYARREDARERDRRRRRRLPARPAGSSGRRRPASTSSSCPSRSQCHRYTAAPGSGAAGRAVEDRELDRSAGRPRPYRSTTPKLEPDVAAHDAALGQHVRAVGAVARDTGRPSPRGSRSCSIPLRRRSSSTTTRPRSSTWSVAALGVGAVVAAARGRDGDDGGAAEELQRLPAVHERREVEPQPAVVVFDGVLVRVVSAGCHERSWVGCGLRYLAAPTRELLVHPP